MVDLIERHFAAINARDYEGWANTVTSRRAVVALASGPRIDIPARGSMTKQAC